MIRTRWRSLAHESRWRRRTRRWILRYGPPELVSIATALLGSVLVHAVTGSEIAAAYGGVAGASLGFYGVVVVRDLRQTPHDASQGTWDRMRGLARSIILEFGPAELLDVVVIRPVAIWWATGVLGRAVGVPLGTVAADLTFYAVAIASVELRRPHASAELDTESQ